MLKTIEQRVLKFIDENHLIQRNDKVLIALSGGADSVFLLHFLLKFKRRLGISLGAFHLNHRLRGADAKDDESFCGSLCAAENVELFLASKNVKSFAMKNKISAEEAGRIIRYKELNNVADKNSFSKIATAHNASDNAETVLLNLIKGAGLRGLSGIPVKRGRIIRPILNLSAEEIRNYIHKMKIDYRFDKSNLQPDYERNFLRNKIIPALKKRLNPRLEQKILASSLIIRDIRSFIDKQILPVQKSAVKFSNGELRLNLKKLKSLDLSLWGEFFKTSIEEKFGIELSGENLNSLIRLASIQTGKKVNLSGQIFAMKIRDYLLIKLEPKKTKRAFSKTIKAGKGIIVNNHKLLITPVRIADVKRSRNQSVEYISADNIAANFELRKWKAGDRFYPLGMRGSKKISDFLADAKIPSDEKKEQLVLTNSGKIVWVLNLRIDDRFKITPDTKKVFKLSYQ